MAFRVSRRAKYVIVLAFVTLCLYASIGSDSMNSIHLQDTSSMIPDTNLKLDLEEDFDVDIPQDDKFEIPSMSVDSTIEAPRVDFVPAAKETPDRLPQETHEVAEKPVTIGVTDTILQESHSDQSTSKVGDESRESVATPPTKSRPDHPGPDQILPTANEETFKPPAIRESFDLHRVEKYPVISSDLKTLPKASNVQIPKIQVEDPTLTETAAEKQVRLQRQAEIKSTFQRDWAAYRQFAWMHDELRPVTNGTNDPFGGWGATLVDALDTLLIMNLRKEYEEASKAVAKIDFTFTESRQIPLFETTIRYLGGLLSAYDLGVAQGHRDPVMLTQAKLLGKVLYGAFDTPNRLPMLKYDYREQAATKRIMRAESDGVMSEAGSLSVEFTRLAQLSEGEDQDRMFDAIQRITDAFDDSMEFMSVSGLWPVRLDFSGCKPLSRQASRPSTFQSTPQYVDNTKPIASSNPASSSLDIGNAPSSGTVKSAPGRPEFLRPGQKASVSQLEDVHDATNELLDVLKAQKMSADKVDRTPNTKRQSTATTTKAHDPTVPIVEAAEDLCDPQGVRPPPHVSSQTYSQGALADSTYEYFTKEFLLLGGGDAGAQYKRLYELSIEATKKWLLFKPLVPGDLGAHQLLMSGDLETHTDKE